MIEYESQFKTLVVDLLDKCGYDYTTEASPTGMNSYADIHLTEYDTMIELKVRGDQRKGIGQCLEYDDYCENALLLVPKENINMDIAKVAVNSDIGYGILNVDNNDLHLTAPYEFVIDPAARRGEFNIRVGRLVV